MLPIELPIYFNTDETDNLLKMGMDYHIKNCEIRILTFFQISAIGPAIEDDGFKYSLIYTSADSFSCVHTYEELKTLLNPQQQSI